MSEGGNVIAEAQKRALEIAAKLTASAGSYANGDENSRKRPLEDNSADAPDTKKSFTDGFSQQDNAKLIAQAAISKITGQLGLAQSLTIEIKVPNRMVGLIIGRQGEMINKLQADSGAKIQVAPDGSEINGERQVSISGSPDTVEKAKMLVNAVIEEAGGVTSVAMMNLEPGQEVIELMIPANKVGLIIGKGGEMIKMLQERAGCKMQMIQDGPFANTPEKPLRMTGFQENCKKARQLVLDLMDQKEMEVFNSLVSDMSPGLLEVSYSYMYCNG
jgi:far upstream element-binding protein